jgi:hypothetical protein
MPTNPTTPEQNYKIYDIILDLAHKGSMMQRGETMNAGMFPEAKAAIQAMILEAELKAIIAELESFYTTVPGAPSDWIDDRITDLKAQLEQLK